LAERAGVSEPFVNRLERGERLGHAGKLSMLRDALLQANVGFFTTETEFGVSLHGTSASEIRAEWRGRRDKQDQ